MWEVLLYSRRVELQVPVSRKTVEYAVDSPPTLESGKGLPNQVSGHILAVVGVVVFPAVDVRHEAVGRKGLGDSLSRGLYLRVVGGVLNEGQPLDNGVKVGEVELWQPCHAFGHSLLHECQVLCGLLCCCFALR